MSLPQPRIVQDSWVVCMRREDEWLIASLSVASFRSLVHAWSPTSGGGYTRLGKEVG